MMKMTIVTIEKDPGSSRASLQRFSFNAVLATCVWITVIMYCGFVFSAISWI
jgi:membrane protein DedA with SNARE-associated domain